MMLRRLFLLIIATCLAGCSPASQGWTRSENSAFSLNHDLADCRQSAFASAAATTRSGIHAPRSAYSSFLHRCMASRGWRLQQDNNEHTDSSPTILLHAPPGFTASDTATRHVGSTRTVTRHYSSPTRGELVLTLHFGATSQANPDILQGLHLYSSTTYANGFSLVAFRQGAANLLDWQALFSARIQRSSHETLLVVAGTTLSPQTAKPQNGLMLDPAQRSELEAFTQFWEQQLWAYGAMSSSKPSFWSRLLPIEFD